MDSNIEHMRVLRQATVGTVQSTTMVSKPRPMHLRHTRSSSTPALLVSSPLKSPEPTKRRESITPATEDESVNDEDDEDTEVEQESEHTKLHPSQGVPPRATTSVVPSAGERDLATKTNNTPSEMPKVLATPATPAAAPVAPQPTPAPITTPAPAPAPAVTQEPVSKDEMPAPTESTSAATAAAAAASSFLSSWSGRSKAMIPSIPRPSPLMPFRAARSVVSSVTSVGTGLLPTVSSTKGLSLPSKEQLSAIPIAGRILNHPAMDSALNYVADKASERGISLAALTGGIDPRYAILPEDIPYRQLNKSMVQQAMTLAALAVQKEENSKSMDDEASDDAFELYLAALSTMLHALPFETCDPLRREAFETQLRDFVDDQMEGLPAMDEYRVDDDKSKRHRRHRRRRQRQHHELASTLLQKHSAAAEQEPQYQQMRGQQAKQRRQRREQHTRQMMELKKQQQQAAQQQQQQQKEKEKEKEKEAKAKAKKPKTSAAPPVPSTPTTTIKSGKHSRRSHRFRGVAHNAVHDQDAFHANYQQGAGGHPVNGPAIGDAIVHSAIRLKQSPIPDVVRSGLRISKTIFNKVDERFHLQDKAWELSKTSIEKAIELDEQYAIHEVVTDAVFSTITGLVKAGIAYKESPSYTEMRAAKEAEKTSLEGVQQGAITDGASVSNNGHSHNPQAVQSSKKQTSKAAPEVATPAPAQRRGWRSSSASSATTVTSKKPAKVAVESDSDSELDSDEETVLPSASSTSSDADATASEGEDEVIELNQQTLRPGKGGKAGGASGYGSETRKGSFGQSNNASAAYAGQVREKIDMFMALKGAASLIVNL
ncbi:hypothetical protein BGX31_004178 [Mortierella sp. GBA43]|nr:hypothetical protein BGX31_004178 [Mortierella sp. GBA43]